MSRIDEAIESLSSEALGYVVLAAGKDGTVHSRSSEANLVVPLVSSNASRSLEPKNIIDFIKTVGALEIRPKKPRKQKAKKIPAVEAPSTAKVE